MGPSHDRPARGQHPIDPLLDARADAPGRPVGRSDRTTSHHSGAPRRTVFGIGAVAVAVLGLAVVAQARSDDSPEVDASVTVVATVADADPATEPASDEVVDTEFRAPGSERAGAAGFASDGSLVDGDDAVVDDEEAPDGLPDLVGGDPAAAGCAMSVTSLRLGASGPDVACLQAALADAGTYSGAMHGEFDQATFTAASRLQQERDLFVDGVVGRETAISLGIWPDEDDLVVRTPPPAPGAVDLHGFPLSSVSSVGADAPPLPENSGTGKRVVYDRMGQRVWAVEADGSIVRSWLVSGSMYANELAGTHTVYSRSEWSTAWNGAAKLPLMIRWLQTERGHIGFHGIPLRVSDGDAYQTEDELGTRLSGGCQRQANPDAEFLWHFAPVGTSVVVT